MVLNDEAVACVFAFEGTFFRIMSNQFHEDLSTVNMNMDIEFPAKISRGRAARRRRPSRGRRRAAAASCIAPEQRSASYRRRRRRAPPLHPLRDPSRRVREPRGRAAPCNVPGARRGSAAKPQLDRGERGGACP